ncbi:MAG: gamma carbonic anhydrase family protein [Candidatus Kapabacteria bacterium]|jgi:carbonic anhydrase/acetyltransferase-like protein (isoleucine patch superfamily)|nr:gamma carbonic anhydrase family protein [Candidatus Kapabacteria bacterium]
MPHIINPQQTTVIPFNGITPRIHDSVTIFDGVRITGDVEIGEDCTIWYNSVIRGDVNFIRIGKRTNVQDLSMLHVTHEKYPLHIGNDVTLGHSVVVHGCTIHDHALIGMGARVLDGVVVNSHSIVAAGAIVRERFIVPEGVLVAGIPAKIIRDLTDDDRKMITVIPPRYVDVAATYRKDAGLKE